MLGTITWLDLYRVMLNVGGLMVDKVQYVTVITTNVAHTSPGHNLGAKSDRHNEVRCVKGRRG